MNIDNKSINKYGSCSFCDSTKLSKVIDFGDVALAGGFLNKEDFKDEIKYPLTIVFCNDCYAVQVRDHVDPSVLFKTDFYFSSAIKTLRDHFSEYASEIVNKYLNNPMESAVLEFGSNDGVLLKPLKELGVATVIGVDPATNIVESIKNDNDELHLINDFFNPESSKRIVEKFGKIDIIMANNVFAHITDINGTTEAVFSTLKEDGIFVFEVHYLGKILEDMQYDMIYHEHIYYYSLIALQNHFKRHNMVIFDLNEVPTHGGSIRYYVAKEDSKYSKSISSNVKNLRSKELSLGYDKPSTYKDFEKKVNRTKVNLMNLVDLIKKKNERIVGYGASGRANTIIQYCSINNDDLDYIVDDAPAKQGLYTPGSHIRILPNTQLEKNPPEYILLFAWSFYEEIVKKCKDYIKNGGKIIIPLPEVRIVEESDI